MHNYTGDYCLQPGSNLTVHTYDFLLPTQAANNVKGIQQRNTRSGGAAGFKNGTYKAFV